MADSSDILSRLQELEAENAKLKKGMQEISAASAELAAQAATLNAKQKANDARILEEKRWRNHEMAQAKREARR